MKIEFFHDVICSFCFPMSARMRKIADLFPEVDIIHRSFALGWDEMDFIRMFGSRKAVKPEVLTHWVHANQNDEEHRFNIEGMRKTDFDFPLSRLPLLSAKAAGMIGGEKAYWDAFDKIQQKLFVENKNIEEQVVIEEAIAEAGIDVEKWREQLNNPLTEEMVREDFERVRRYGIRSVPSLVINGQTLISGAIPLERLVEALKTIAAQERQEQANIQDNNLDGNGSCNLNEKGMNCN